MGGNVLPKWAAKALAFLGFRQADASATSRRGLAIAGLIALVPLLAILFTSGNYGLFNDEFYYLACADRLAFGYVDHPPLSIAVLAAWTAVFGDSVESIRVLPAFAGAAMILLTAVMVRDLGGGVFAQAFAALCIAISGFVAMAGIYSMNIFDMVFWALLFIILIRLIKTGDTKLWLLFGLVAGIGLQNKIGLLALGLALVVALPFTPHRKFFAEKRFWFGTAIAAVVFLPHVIWQVVNGLPTREFVHNAQTFKIAQLSQLEFFAQQAFMPHPILFPIWLIGLGALFLYKPLRPYRLLGLMYVVCYLFFALQTSKPYYLAGAYPILIAVGAFMVERWISPRASKWVKPPLVVFVTAVGVMGYPLMLPIFPVASFVEFTEGIGMEFESAERNESGALPEYFAGRFGWRNIAETVADAYAELTPEQQAEAVVFTGAYAEAGAIEYYGANLDLPPAISGHNNYYLWGPGSASGEVVLTVGLSREMLSEYWESVEQVAQIESPYALPRLASMPVYLCTGPKRPLDEIWPELKHFI